uniref:JAKMIP_CC3 domain-containing protein n=1 Tax=Steinernema glaseri TaxID=37863 RepID=A0A1I7YYS5_9BILA
MSSPMFTPFIINTPSMIKSRNGAKKQQQQQQRRPSDAQGQQPLPAEPLIDNRPRRPKACVGDGELLRLPSNAGASTTAASTASSSGESRPVFRLIRSSTGTSTTATPTTVVTTSAAVKRRLPVAVNPGAAPLQRSVAETATPPKRILIRKAPQSSVSSPPQQASAPEPSSSNAHTDGGAAGNESDSQHDEIIDVMGGLEETLDVDRKPIHVATGSPRVRMHRQRYEDDLDEDTRNNPQAAALANSYNELAACLKRNPLSGSPNTEAMIEQLTAANVALREVRKQNEQLTKKNEIYSSKLKQMESLLMDRNLRLKKLLSDNLRMGARLRRMESEVGVDRVKELFGSD